MAFDLEMNIRQDQKMLMTPQLEYSLKILKLNNDELIEFIEEEMLGNPLLEYSENTQSIPKHTVKEYDVIEDKPYKGDSDEEINYLNSIPDVRTMKPSLTQHLMLQLHTLKITHEMSTICEFLIESVDSNGYLNIDTLEGAQILSTTPDKVEKGISIIQGFDPPGIGARNLKECLRLQMIRKEVNNIQLFMLVDEYLEAIAANKIPQIAHALGSDISKVNEMIQIIKSLNPKPGSSFSVETVSFIRPDVIVTKVEDTFNISVNKEQIPAIQVSAYYSDLLNKRSFLIKDEYNYINKNFTNATWLIRCIEQRLQTLERVTGAIVERQIDFFNFGKHSLKPLTLKEIAYELDLHESTISRAVNGKYLLCQWGIFELKYFFSSKTIKRDVGEDGSSSHAKYALQQIIDNEDKTKPLSDIAICECLKEKSINISRRTVAKYRAQLNIPAMDLRKKY